MISIVIPAREEEKYIGDALQYIKHSLTLPHEIIVSDGASTDKTVEVARRTADKVVTFAGGRKHNPGIGRNDGARVATGEFLLFLDTDTRIHDMNTVLTDAIARFEKDPRLLGLAGGQRTYPETERFGDKIVFGIDNMINRFFNNVLRIGWGCGKSLMVRRKTFEELGGFREDLVFGEDHELFQRLAKIGSTRFLGSLTAYHSARRLHKFGMWKFWWVWIINELSVRFRNKAQVDEWTPVR